MQIYHAVPADKQIEKSISTEVMKVFEFTEKTELVVVSSHEEALPYFGFEKGKEVNTDRKVVKLSADQVMQKLKESFVGYEGPARLAVGMTCLGLGFLNNDEVTYIDEGNDVSASLHVETDALDGAESVSPSNKNIQLSLPVGALIYGPPGIGKSQLVRSIISTLTCNSVIIDSNVLLSP